MDDTISADDKEIVVIISNVGSKDVVINSISSTCTVSSGHVELVEPVVRSGGCIYQKIQVDPAGKDYFVMNLTVTYTRDLTPVSQNYSFKVSVT